jgi:hypothetical protein
VAELEPADKQGPGQVQEDHGPGAFHMVAGNLSDDESLDTIIISFNGPLTIGIVSYCFRNEK